MKIIKKSEYNLTLTEDDMRMLIEIVDYAEREVYSLYETDPEISQEDREEVCALLADLKAKW